LEQLDLRAPTAVDAQVRHQCDREGIAQHVPTVAAMVRAALASPALQLARDHPHHHELYVIAPVGERVVEGYVDLLIETPEGLIVVDYKTDSAQSPAEIDAKLSTYELQGASYAVALEVVTGQPVIDCRFVFCRPGGAIERSVVDLPGAKARVRRALGEDPLVGTAVES
jgi:ATP-dependent helicase/nuclease subunit A